MTMGPVYALMNNVVVASSFVDASVDMGSALGLVRGSRLFRDEHVYGHEDECMWFHAFQIRQRLCNKYSKCCPYAF